MSFCLDCGFVVRLAVFVNKSVPVLLRPVLYCLNMHSSVSILALSCSSFYKVVTEFLRQSGRSCGRDRTRPGASTPYWRWCVCISWKEYCELVCLKVKTLRYFNACVWTLTHTSWANRRQQAIHCYIALVFWISICRLHGLIHACASIELTWVSWQSSCINCPAFVLWICACFLGMLTWYQIN